MTTQTTAPRSSRAERRSSKDDDSPEARPYCYDCLRPASHCYCASLPAIDNQTKIVIVQHPRERAHAIGTARLARLALRNSELHIDHGQRFTTEEISLPAGAGLLYPGPDSKILDDLDAAERPEALVVIDGTWHHAKYLFRDVPWLRSLPRYSLKPAAPSRYRIRREPAAHCVSTVEAIVLALSALEPGLAGLDELLVSFDRMIDKQIAARDSRRGALGAKRQRAAPRPGAVLDVLRDAAHRLVFVYAETLGGKRGGSAKGSSAAAKGTPRTLLSLTAERSSSGEIFGMICQGDEHISDPHLSYLGLTRPQFDAATSREELNRRFLEFAKPDDIYVAWNQSTLDLLPRAQHGQSTVLLKAAYLNGRRFRGALNEIVEAEGLAEAQDAQHAGLLERSSITATAGERALCRIANLKCIVMLLRERNTAPHNAPGDEGR